MSQPHCLSGLRAARIDANISVEHAAAALNMSVTSYYRFENGTRRMYWDKACALADLFNCSTEAFRRDPELHQHTATVMVPAIATSESDTTLAGWELDQ